MAVFFCYDGSLFILEIAKRVHQQATNFIVKKYIFCTL